MPPSEKTRDSAEAGRRIGKVRQPRRKTIGSRRRECCVVGSQQRDGVKRISSPAPWRAPRDAQRGLRQIEIGGLGRDAGIFSCWPSMMVASPVPPPETSTRNGGRARYGRQTGNARDGEMARER